MKEFVLALVLLGGAGSVADAAERVLEFFPEDSLLRGFLVSPARISRQIPLAAFERLQPLDAGSSEPFWTLNQWFCVERLCDDHQICFGEHEAAWRNPYQALRVTVTDGGRPMVRLTVDALAVYEHMELTYERMGRIRPHVLLSHNFYPDVGGMRRYGGAEEEDTTPDASLFPELDTLAALTLAMDLQLEEATDLRAHYPHDAPGNRRRHYNRACFQFWFRVYCKDPQSPSHGRFFWLGYRAYDGEVPYASHIPHERDQIESDGNMTFAYRLCDMSVHGAEYASHVSGFHEGKETAVTIDLLLAARKAIRAIQGEKRAFLDASGDLSGWTLSSFNIGWEPACPFRGTMAIRNLSLRGRQLVSEDAAAP